MYLNGLDPMGMAIKIMKEMALGKCEKCGRWTQDLKRCDNCSFLYCRVCSAMHRQPGDICIDCEDELGDDGIKELMNIINKDKLIQ